MTGVVRSVAFFVIRTATFSRSVRPFLSDVGTHGPAPVRCFEMMGLATIEERDQCARVEQELTGHASARPARTRDVVPPGRGLQTTASRGDARHGRPACGRPAAQPQGTLERHADDVRRPAAQVARRLSERTTERRGQANRDLIVHQRTSIRALQSVVQRTARRQGRGSAHGAVFRAVRAPALGDAPPGGSQGDTAGGGCGCTASRGKRATRPPLLPPCPTSTSPGTAVPSRSTSRGAW